MTEAELQAAREKTEWVRTTYLWKTAHIKDYEPTQANDDRLAAYFNAHQLPLTYHSLEKAFAALKAQGERYVAEKQLPDLPEVPGMNPKIFTVSDINNMDRERYKRLYFGPHKDQFRARVAEIIHRAKAEQE